MQDTRHRQDEIDIFTRIVHLGLIVFGLLAWATGDMADDYKKMENFGFYVHAWIGIGVTFFAGLRLVYGVVGPQPARFITWAPFTRERLLVVRADIMGLLQLQLPERGSRQGLAALVETSGLLIFFFLAATGVLLFILIEPGQKASGLVHFVKELHEAGELLLPLFFSVHGGAVILHALAGKHLWKKMLFVR